MRAPFSSQLCQYWLFPDFLIYPVLMGVVWYLVVVLICISLTVVIANAFIFILAIQFRGSVWSSPFYNFLLDLLVFVCGKFHESFVYLNINPLSISKVSLFYLSLGFFSYASPFKLKVVLFVCFCFYYLVTSLII